MRLVIEITEGPALGRRKAVRAPCKMTVGRSGDADLSIAGDLLMSSTHFQLDCQSQQCTLRDLHSTNGTTVNGQPIHTAVTLQDGDTVAAGKSRFRISVEKPAAPPVAPAAMPRVGMTINPPPPAAPVPAPGVETQIPPAQTSPAPRVAKSVAGGGGGIVVSLQVISGPDEGRKAWLRAGQSLRIGGSEQSDFVVHRDAALYDMRVSLHFDGRVCRVCDVGQPQGTTLNGTPISEAEIYVGDRLQIGDTIFRVTAGPSPPESDAQAHSADAPPKAFAMRDLIHKWVPAHVRWPFARGLSDDVAAIRNEAMRAAAWSRQPWLIDYCAEACVHPRLDLAMEVAECFAMLADGDRLPTLKALLQRRELGPQRYRLAGIYGHPAVLDELITALTSSDMASAGAASWALQRITGADLPTLERSGERSDDQSEGALVIDPRAARDYYRSSRQMFAAGTRYSRGIDLTPGQSWQPRQLDLASRFEAILREHYHGRRMASRWEKQSRFTASASSADGCPPPATGTSAAEST